jgi:hypothetical protein
MKPRYVKIKARSIKRSFWAIEQEPTGGFRSFVRCNKEGDYNLNNKINVLLLGNSDIEWTKQARMNNHYGELEVSKWLSTRMN